MTYQDYLLRAGLTWYSDWLEGGGWNDQCSTLGGGWEFFSSTPGPYPFWVPEADRLSPLVPRSRMCGSVNPQTNTLPRRGYQLKITGTNLLYCEN